MKPLTRAGTRFPHVENNGRNGKETSDQGISRMLDSFLKIKSHGLQGGVDSIESEAAPKFIIRNTVVTDILAHTHIGRISWDMTGRAGRYPWSTWQGRPAEKQQETGTPKSWTSAPTLSPPLPSCYSLICVRTTETAPRVRGRLAVFLEKETEGVGGEERNCLLSLSLLARKQQQHCAVRFLCF
jgi:hypothetical protein